MTRHELGVTAICVASVVAGCAGRAAEPLSRHFLTNLPANVRVVNFYGDFYKDPSFLWELSPADPVFVAALVKNATLAPATPGMDRTPPCPMPPAWWPGDALKNLNEMYFRDPGPTDGSYYRVWVDRDRKRVFILFMNT